MSFTWQHISYSDGSNPYICTTQKRFNQLKHKYGSAMTKVEENYWMVTVKQETKLDDIWGQLI